MTQYKSIKLPPKINKRQRSKRREIGLLLLAFLFLPMSIWAQQKPLEQSITVQLTQTDALQVIRELARQTSGFSFSYSREALAAVKIETINLRNTPLSLALKQLEKKYNLEFSVQAKTISVKTNGIVATPAPSPDKQSLQFIEVSGVVSDSTGVLSEVSILVKGANIATVTDKLGRYRLSVPNENAVLQFSLVGYQTEEVVVSNRTSLDIKMHTAAGTLNEVVIVAFGSQKRTDMIGSVTSVKPSELKVPASNLTTALAGRVAGLISYQRSGEPGQDNADFFVRGVTTFGYKASPLILIDGMELTTTDLARLQPDDISSFSIMKDATSTALYGARGANGVILVTTKQGAMGKAKLSLRLENSWSGPTRNVELADPVTYMKMANEANLTRSRPDRPYGEEKIANTIAGNNPLIYPANDWRKLLLKNQTTNQRANLNISGGGGVARYYVSGSFNQDNGMLKVDRRNNYNNNISLKSYMLRSNVTIDVTKTTEMIVRLSGNFDDYNGPIDGGAAMYKKIMQSNPVQFPAYYPAVGEQRFVNHIMYGNAANPNGGNYINPYADVTKGYKNYNRSLMLAQLELKQDLSSLIKGLSFRTMMNTNRSSYFEVNRFSRPYYYQLQNFDKLNNVYTIRNINPEEGTDYLLYNEGAKTVTSTFYSESMLRYNGSIANKHSLSGLLVYTLRHNQNANAGDLQQSLPFRNSGLSGRATYAFDERYFAEFNFGYNGSERFSEARRFGFFPSAGLAWSIMNEKFFAPYKKTFTNLRLRSTYGLVGNDEIGSPSDRFFYLSNVEMNDPAKSATFGNGIGQGQTLSGVTIKRYANPDITWETATKKNLALEVGLFNKLNITAEYFEESRNNILMSRSFIPVTMGLADAIRANVGKASSKGTDISLDYQATFNNGWWLSARGNFTYATSKYTAVEEPQYRETQRSLVEHSLSQRFGLIAERLFTDDYEVANAPRQNFGEYGAGDIKYTDVNRDGQITEADQVPIGNPTVPEIVYGFGFSAGYKNFDFSAFFQGLANESFWIDAAATSPFNNETQVLQAYANSYWSEDHRDSYALWPRLSPNVNANNTLTNTWFMRDGSFLRLKQVEIGYKLPVKWQKKIHASNCRLYVNATNLLTFSKFNLWDIEMGGSGLGYPVQRVFNVGINISFN